MTVSFAWFMFVFPFFCLKLMPSQIITGLDAICTSAVNVFVYLSLLLTSCYTPIYTVYVLLLCSFPWLRSWCNFIRQVSPHCALTENNNRHYQATWPIRDYTHNRSITKTPESTQKQVAQLWQWARAKLETFWINVHRYSQNHAQIAFLGHFMWYTRVPDDR